MSDDTYNTIAQSTEVASRERGSRFLAYAYPVDNEDDIKEHLDELRKQYYNATHHCYAWRLGAKGEQARDNDDGEPSGTAGKPILGQLLSKNLTNILVVVVRYFGGTKLGVPGLIKAYRESAKEVLDACEVVERTIDVRYEVQFSYLAMNDVMRIVKDLEPEVISQKFDNLCQMTLAIRQSQAEQLKERLLNTEGVEIEEKEKEEGEQG